MCFKGRTISKERMNSALVLLIFTMINGNRYRSFHEFDQTRWMWLLNNAFCSLPNHDFGPKAKEEGKRKPTEINYIIFLETYSRIYLNKCLGFKLKSKLEQCPTYLSNYIFLVWHLGEKYFVLRLSFPMWAFQSRYGF